MTTDLALPTSSDHTRWTPQELALAEAAGLVVKRGPNLVPVPRPAAEAFLHHCRRTGLDPIARQIYLIERGGKHTIQVSIDGARLVAQRSGQYGGQTPTQWTDGTRAMRPYLEDGKVVRDGNGNIVMIEDYVWHDVWLSSTPPAAARVGVYREGFPEPIVAVANWDAYNAGGSMWKKMPALMLGKCAEMLALRKAFPQDLSGLYSTEEMDQAGGAPAAASSTPQSGPQSAPRAELEHNDDLAQQWLAEAAKAVTKADLRQVFQDAKEKNALMLAVPNPDMTPGMPTEIPLGQHLVTLGKALPDVAESGEVLEGEVEDGPDLVAQAQAKLNSDEA